MDGKWAIWFSVIISAIAISILLRVMMLEFDNNGLSCLAVVLGLFAVGVLQCEGFFISDRFRNLPEESKDNFWKL